jgi:hypothetical protein
VVTLTQGVPGRGLDLLQPCVRPVEGHARTDSQSRQITLGGAKFRVLGCRILKDHG